MPDPQNDALTPLRAAVMQAAEKLEIFSPADIAGELGHTGKRARATQVCVLQMTERGLLRKIDRGVYRHPSVSADNERLSTKAISARSARSPATRRTPGSPGEPSEREIVSAVKAIVVQHLTRNAVPTDELAALISQVRRSLTGRDG